MASLNNQFHVVEFEDGIQVIPDNWIQKDTNKCWYPNYKTDQYITKAIKRRQTPQDTWFMYPIKRIFGVYESYSEARNKLKKAEINSDINSDMDDKTNRKLRARKQIETDNESDDESDYDSDPMSLPAFPKVPTAVYTNTYKGDTQNQTQKDTEEYIQIKNYLQRIERAVLDIKFDISHLTEQYQLLSTKISNGSNLTRKCHSPLSQDDELSKLSFPLKTVEELESLQHMLSSSEENLKEYMFNKLAAIGGSTYEEMSKRMFIYTFTNEVASLYSWVGRKGKQKLNNLEIMKLIFKVVRKTFPHVTEKDFETKCKDWFRHAKHRFENEKRRQSNATQQ